MFSVVTKSGPPRAVPRHSSTNLRTRARDRQRYRSLFALLFSWPPDSAGFGAELGSKAFGQFHTCRHPASPNCPRLGMIHSVSAPIRPSSPRGQRTAMLPTLLLIWPVAQRRRLPSGLAAYSQIQHGQRSSLNVRSTPKRTRVARQCNMSRCAKSGRTRLPVSPVHSSPAFASPSLIR